SVDVEEARECLVVEVLGEPQRHEQGDAHLLGCRLLAHPVRERGPPGSGDAERTAVARTGRAGAYEAAGLERLQLAVHVARGHVPESGEPAPRLFEEVPARR